ncbi:MAG: hypothetical protein HZA31_10160 [Opitutae bacterium]|nr:hypothetical protein [Opitutae bacterium]
MSDAATPGAPVDPEPAARTPFDEHYERYRATPDPWQELAKLEYGADRSYATTVAGLINNAEPAQRAGMEKKLLAVLIRSDCTAAARAFVCQMLARIGTAACVPALAALLRDAATADDARFALETLPDPAVDAALRDALSSLAGPAKAGLIGSIAIRNDKAALPALQSIAQDAAEPALVRETAARAVARLNRPAATS